MIPRRLHVHNFLSYRDCTVDFTPLHLAAVSGPNGHGKSALLDAITWATWGRSRAPTDDEALFLGEAEMLVDFEFEAGDQRYAVNRKKTRGKTGQLQFFQVGEDGARVALTGSVMRETQALINRALHLDHDTFRNSVFIAQGHADEFTRKTAAERKAVLRNVLGLERFEQYALRARDFSKERDAALKELRLRIGEGLERVGRLPEVRDRLEALAAEEAGASRTLVRTEEDLAALRLAAAEFDRRTRELADAEEEQQRHAGRVAAAAERLNESLAEIARADAILAGGQAIRERHARLVALREEEGTLAARQREAQACADAIARANVVIAAAAAAVRAEIESARAAVAGAEEAAGRLPALDSLAAEMARRQAAIEALQVKERAAAADAEEHRRRGATERAAAAAARDQAQAIKEREGQIEGVAVCPVCRTPLAPDQVAHVRDEYAAERRALGARYREALAAAAAADEAAATSDREAARLRDEREAADRALREADRALHAEREAVRHLVEALPAARDRVAAAEARLRGGDFEPAAKQQITDAERALATIAYDPARHEAVRLEVRSLADCEAEFRTLEAAAGRAEAARTMADWARGESERAGADLAAADARLADARAAATAATDVSGPLAETAAAVAALQSQVRDLARQRGQAEHERDALIELEASLEEARDREAGLADELALFGDLARAFGRDGVQAMLIDQAIPRIEVIANDLLARMTGGRIQLQLSTRRETRGGTIAETLDIRIADELGQRDYEMFSGGEAFRIDFALRIALAQVLAERSGGSLATLIIDEGFGSQDQEGLDRLIDALLSIKERFRLVLVVTHIEELKARFDRRIEVVKDPVRGSVATVI